ncbi:MAG: hypothetical protein V4819_06485 [Verrucomicrobiota bacterium]
MVPPSAPGGYAPASWEWLVVMVLLLGGFVFNRATYNLYPTVWADEVLWTEPAINLVKTGHFTTSVWQFQRAGSFWAAQSPLYCFGLAGWMKVVGTDLLAARSFNFALASLAIFLTWAAAWRCRLISRPALRILIVPLLLTGYGMSFSFRCSRPDIAGMICLVCFGLAFYIRHDKLRLGALFLCALAAPWIGIQVALCLAVVCALAKLFFRQVTMRLCLLLAAGVCLGLASMFIFYHSHGVLNDLMNSIFQAANEKQHFGQKDSYWASIPKRFHDTLSAYTGDMSCAALMAGLVIGVALKPGIISSRENRGNRYLLGIVLTVPLIFTLLAHFAFYYAYMIYVPLVLVFLVALEQHGLYEKWKMGLGAAVITAACLVGLPLRLLISIYDCKIVPRDQYAPLIQAALSPSDVVFADYTAFFECKAVTAKVYSPMYSRYFVSLSDAAQDFTDQEKAQVNVLVIPASQIDEMKRYWGGEWVAATPKLGDSISGNGFSTLPLVGKRMQSYLTNPQSVRRPLQVFRRVAGTSAMPAATEARTEQPVGGGE